MGMFQRLEFQGHSGGPHLLITAGVHGDEFEPMAAVRQLAEFLAQESSRLQGRVTLVPCVNEEAFLLGARCASDGLDLARTCPGNAQGSVTEQLAAEISELIESADYYIDLHTGGTELSIYPLAGYVLHSDESVLEKQRKMAQAFNLNVIWGTSPELQGRTLSVARDANVPAIYAEYFGAATCSKEGTDAYVDGCLNVMGALEMIERTSPPSRIEYVVEDRRPDSGHLQICNPSPVDGYFETAVGLGEKISTGDLLGTVFCLKDHNSYPVNSDQNGIVLTLRTFPRVLAGQSVAVILESGENVS
ncbi:succinylglutamate desuccinylase/aspartoacylase family protein [Thalassoglobus sp.]|uniref:succinylglutamate desuccinylase/aspartoacylase family protein n=1 Tax=Thalassoglobus sp. TaxID=2795869 RepID=UPI003AA818A2